MVLPGHLAGGYLATAAILAVADPALAPAQLTALLIIGTLAGEGPDIDLAFHYLNQKSKNPSLDSNGHRRYVTHTPIFWIGSSLTIVAGGLTLDSSFVQMAGWAILAGSLSHLLLDSIEFGIRWLWPFSSRRFCLRQVPEPEILGPKGTPSYYLELIRRTSLKQVTFYAEIALTIAAICFFLRS